MKYYSDYREKGKYVYFYTDCPMRSFILRLMHTTKHHSRQTSWLKSLFKRTL